MGHTARNITDAVKLASEWKANGTHSWFRGQNKLWPVVSSLVRRSCGITIFVNGTPMASGPLGSGGNVDTTSSLKFGHRGGPSDTPGSSDGRGFFLNGRIDELELFVGRALSDAEIGAIYYAGSKGKCKSTDNTSPVFGACPAGGPFLLNSGLHPIGPISVQDPESGIDTSASTLSGSVDTSSVGTKTVTFTAVNTVGLRATKKCDYSVRYAFAGFFQPIDNNVPNSAKAGQSIPIKWRITDATGAPISDPNSFVSVTSVATPGACGGTADAIETYAGSSGLQYLGDGYWQFSWKTPASYAGQCRTLTLNLKDGASGRSAAFTFK